MSSIAKYLPRNESNLDRALRIGIGLFVVSLMFWGPKTMFGLIGLVPIITGALGSCPLYTVFGIRSCPIQQRE